MELQKLEAQDVGMNVDTHVSEMEMGGLLLGFFQKHLQFVIQSASEENKFPIL
jgi:hypothetical protein